MSENTIVDIFWSINVRDYMMFKQALEIVDCYLIVWLELVNFLSWNINNQEVDFGSYLDNNLFTQSVPLASFAGYETIGMGKWIKQWTNITIFIFNHSSISSIENILYNFVDILV